MSYKCRKCAAESELAPGMEGRQVRCSVCGADFVVPSAPGIDSGGSCGSNGVDAEIVGTYDERILDSVLFAKSSKEEVRNLNLKITELSFGEGEIIFEEGDEGSHLYLVLEGKVRISKQGRGGKQETLFVQSSGDFFGEMSLLDGGNRSARATANSHVTLGKIEKQEIERFLSQSSGSPLWFAQHVVTNLRITNSVFIDKLVETERLSLLGTMMTGIVHDFRNPIATLEMLNHFLQSHEDPVIVELGKTAESSVGRMKVMIQELLDFSRGDSKLNLSKVHVSDLIAKLDEQILKRVEGSGVEVKRNIEYTDFITVDFNRLQRLLENIIKNSWEAMSTEGQLTVQVKRIGDSIEFQIADTGRGIAPELLANVFEPFVTHGKKNGTGLGMAIAKSVIDAHRGDIRIESEVNRGTTCFVTLPFPPSPAEVA